MVYYYNSYNNHCYFYSNHSEKEFRNKKRIYSDLDNRNLEPLSSDELKSISEFFNNNKTEKKESFFIDEITWNDLDMDSAFRNINFTESSPGEQYLYNILREPVFDEKELLFRDKLIHFFQTNKTVRKKLQYILAKLGKKRECFISDYFYNNDKNKSSSSIFYRCLAILPIVCVCIAFLNVYLGFSLTLLASLINILISYTEKNCIRYKLEAFKYIVQILNHANLILKENITELDPYNKRLKKSISSMKKIKNTIFSSENNGTDAGVMYEYINMIFLLDLINYEKMSDALIKKSEEFKIIFQIVGTIDSLIAIALYRETLNYYITPQLVKLNSKHYNDNIFKDIAHPLIENQIPNSIDISDSILITESNASGKSTFLKTLAINIIFAQTIYTCLAKEFKCCFLKIYTSMALKDSIFNNESYYVAETKSLKRIIDSLNDSIPSICFVDEILRGTNTIERISASSQVLKYLTTHNCICVAATHDLELTYILERYFSNYHFEEKIIDNEIIFDYKVHKGRSTTQNAIKLLGILGYSDMIVNKSEEKATKFLKNGAWEVE